MKLVNVYAAKTSLSQLLDQAEAGEDVVIARNGRPVARLTRLSPAKPRVRFGSLKGELKVPADFDAALPESVLRSFSGD